ncbi:MAG: cupin domain-containing protein [Chloroflexota bacterium]
MATVGKTYINQTTGEQICFVHTAASTNGAYVQFENFIQAGQDGPPTHMHFRQEEQFTVLSGELRLVVDGRAIKLCEGETATVPSGTPHTFDNRNGNDVLFRVTLTPALDSEYMFTEMIRLANERNTARPSLRQLAAIFQGLEGRFYLAGPPRILQDMLFSILAGTVRKTA